MYRTNQEDQSAAITHHSQSYYQMINCNTIFFIELIHENDAEESYKYASATLNSSYPSLGIYFSRFHPRDTIPLIGVSYTLPLSFRIHESY